ncbi:MucR family transcriptional regulator [Methylobacterium sp. PvR107]|uniref:MucR family transcriptional regulator n=1 Tax=Methylobacterium sp. PvR107 TaxID=2806597 RepID=UPI001AE2572C|nr:putative transcriptional regulator [Methylobacterium sp. PvR107]
MKAVEPSGQDQNLGRVMRQAAVRLVAAYLSNNAIPRTSLPPLLESVHAALFALADSTDTVRPERREAEPSQVRQSIQRDGLISFIDGRSYKTLKRHLTAHGLTPERYRAQYGLPADYPMVAPGYAEQRSQIAKAIQLGRKAA